MLSAILFLSLFVSLAVGILVWGLTYRVVTQGDALVPPLGEFVEIEGNRIHYYEVGEGRPILMIHGLGGHYHHMRRPLMEAFGPGYRLIAIDRPGSGHSTRAPGLTGRLPEQARLIHAFIGKLGLEKPLLVGHSLGGAVALATALDYPEDVSGLALLSPLTQHLNEIQPQFRSLFITSPVLRRVLAHTIAVPLSVRHSQATLDFAFGPQKPPEDYAIAGGAIIGLRPSHIYATSTDLVAVPRDSEQQQRRYDELRMPVGILFGTGDRVLNYKIHGLRMLDQVPHLDLELVHGTGHMPQYTDTERVVAFVRRIAERAFAVDPGQPVS